VVDQGLSSGAGLALNLVLARWLLGEAYGAFAVAFATLLFFSGFHNVIVLEPMCVIGPARYSRRLGDYFVAQLKVHTVLVAALSGLLLLVAAGMASLSMEPALVRDTAASAVALPFLLLFWLVRRMCYVVHRPSLAVGTSAGYLVSVLAGVFLLRQASWLNAVTALLLVGAAGIFSALMPLQQLGVFWRKSPGACCWRQVARENWAYGRVLTLSITLLWIATQAQTYLAAGLIGLGAAGVLRALQIPSLAMTQIVGAIGLLVLPTMSRDYGAGRSDRILHKAVLTSAGLTAMAVAFAVLLGVFARPLEAAMFGGKFSSESWLIPLFGLVPVSTGFALGFSIALRSAHRPQFDLTANLVSAPLALLVALVFTKQWGLKGAAISVVLGAALNSLVVFYSFRRWASAGKSLPQPAPCCPAVPDVTTN